MLKNIAIIILVLLITGSAVWAVQRVRFFEKLPLLTQSLTALSDNEAALSGRGGGRGGGGRGRGRMNHGGHIAGPSSEGWLNVLAYLSILAGVVMLTYYGERGLCKLRARRAARR